MNPFPISSSVLQAWSYVAASSQLTLQFVDDVVYVYFDVPQQVVEELLRAPSPGRFFNVCIRRRFDFRQVKEFLS